MCFYFTFEIIGSLHVCLCSRFRIRPLGTCTFHPRDSTDSITITAAALCKHSYIRWYAVVVRQLLDCPVPEGTEGEEKFSVFLSSLLRDHTCVPQALSRGVLELEERLVRDLEEYSLRSSPAPPQVCWLWVACSPAERGKEEKRGRGEIEVCY